MGLILRLYSLHRVGNPLQCLCPQQICQRISLFRLWCFKFNNRIFARGVSTSCWFPDGALDSSRIRYLLNNVRTPLLILTPEFINHSLDLSA